MTLSSGSASHPYEALTPDVILDAVEAAGYPCDGRLLALNSYENRVYRVGLEDAEPVVVKFYRPKRWSAQAIAEEHAFSEELASHEIPVVAPVADAAGRTVHEFAGFSFALFPLRPGRWPELNTVEDRLSLGRFVGRIHAVGATRPFVARSTFSVERDARTPLDALLRSTCVPCEVLANLEAAGNALIDDVQARVDALPSIERIRCHGDFHLGNVLWSEFGPSIVDLDDCCTAWPIQDLWLLLDGSRDEMQGQMLDILDGYLEFYEFDYASVPLIEVLRAIRIVRFNGWIAARWSDSAFPHAFPWFATPRHFEELVNTLREQRERLHEPPLRVD
jgi:Ser/Thr protein kinase RdoA (MazF antagonist)